MSKSHNQESHADMVDRRAWLKEHAHLYTVEEAARQFDIDENVIRRDEKAVGVLCKRPRAPGQKIHGAAMPNPVMDRYLRKAW